MNELLRRLIDEAKFAVGMVEESLRALWARDRDAAKIVRRRDDRVDVEEVRIEEACLRLMTLHQPVARDLRMLAFILKVNADIERVADHATSIAKSAQRLSEMDQFEWPTSLQELGERVPMMCHSLLRALLDRDAEAAGRIKQEDKTIDALTRRLFDETVDLMETYPHTQRAGLLVYRAGRELERIGDLMTNIAEDIIYLETGEIVRHEKAVARAEQKQEPGQQSD